MTDLLINVPNTPDPRLGTYFGGRPFLPPGETFSWPTCKSCSGSMQYLGRLAVPQADSAEARHALLFMCQNEPGCCNEWEPGGGGNSVHVAIGHLSEDAAVPATGVTLREAGYAATVVSSSIDDYETARQTWARTSEKSPREVLGQLGGTPVWIQADETPTCDSCGKAMQFLAQLEQGPDWRTEMNFGGGGCAYVFVCSCDSPVGKFLWQCG